MRDRCIFVVFSVWNAVVYFVAICTVVLFNYDHMIAISFNGCAALEVNLCIHRSCFLWITLHKSNAIRSICSTAKVTSKPKYTCIYNNGIGQCVRLSSPRDESQLWKAVRAGSKSVPAFYCTLHFYMFLWDSILVKKRSRPIGSTYCQIFRQNQKLWNEQERVDLEGKHFATHIMCFATLQFWQKNDINSCSTAALSSSSKNSVYTIGTILLFFNGTVVDTKFKWKNICRSFHVVVVSYRYSNLPERTKNWKKPFENYNESETWYVQTL